ncbi:MAG: helix-turn-helix transcriptional regulator [Parvularculaceae bacterium]
MHQHARSGEKVLIRVDRDADAAAVVVASVPAIDGVDNHHTYHLVINDLAARRVAPPGQIADALSISAAEGRLVHALARGLPLSATARELNISTNTARSYLKSVFQKTGAARQAEVVRLAFLATG